MGKSKKKKSSGVAVKHVRSVSKLSSGRASVMMEIEASRTSLTGREKHRQNVALRRAQRSQKDEIRALRLRLPKSSKKEREARKALTAQLKVLKAPILASDDPEPTEVDEAEPVKDDDIHMESNERSKFKYRVNPKVARRAERRLAAAGLEEK